ncbi:ParB/RepB/Spo0J family partition protein [Thalassospira povalilytica]|uniref:ParB/RepB/Spo0J family partition protein n=1 Tax=Thalassospira povalilytica TaxID=732237 RepID=UPI001D193E2C|nr:ParB N-terminal domain-containing protein [Thalassospira povalilytica]MCC4239871.1 ParB N-terminal domain-containing protein [Thalassospira povalilytica]
MSEVDISTEASKALELLRRQIATSQTPTSLPTTLDSKDIVQYPELFQPRYEELDEHHLQGLARIIKQRGKLDPILLLPIGEQGVLIDGHHRFEAYQLTGRSDAIPVEWFQGSIEEAILEAGRLNSKTRLVMGTQERMNYAWRLVLLEEHTKPQISEASGVSDGQLGIMRRVKRELGSDAYQYDSWSEALNFHRRKSREPMDDDQREAWLDALASDYADRLHKTFGRKLGSNPEIAARALALHLGRRLDCVVRELMDHIGEDTLNELDDNDDF